MCVSDALHGRVATVPMLIILNRFAHDQSITAFVEQYVKLALTLFINVEKRAHAGSTEQPFKQPQHKTLDATEIRRTLILEAIAKIIHLGHRNFNAAIRPLVSNASGEYAAIFRTEHGGLRTLVQFFDSDEAAATGTSPPPAEKLFSPTDKLPLLVK